MTDSRYAPADNDLGGWTFKLVEEIGELNEATGQLLHALGKAGRHGFGSYNPYLPDEEQTTNAADALKAMHSVDCEIADLIEAMDKVRPFLHGVKKTFVEKLP